MDRRTAVLGSGSTDPEIFRPDQVACARGMDVKHIKHRSCKRETKRNVVADSDKHMISRKYRLRLPSGSSAKFIFEL